ncbi:kinesin 3 [Tanacetum coccineum]
MQVTLHYEAIVMQVTLHDKRIVMQVTLHYEAIVMQVTLHDKRIVMQVTLHYEAIVMQVTLHDKRIVIVMQVTLHNKRIVMQMSDVSAFEIRTGYEEQMRANSEVRPLMFDEGADKETNSVSFPTARDNLGRGIELLQHGQKHSLMFDKVFVPESSQEEVLEEVSQLMQRPLFSQAKRINEFLGRLPESSMWECSWEMRQVSNKRELPWLWRKVIVGFSMLYKPGKQSYNNKKERTRQACDLFGENRASFSFVNVSIAA